MRRLYLALLIVLVTLSCATKKDIARLEKLYEENTRKEVVRIEKLLDEASELITEEYKQELTVQLVVLKKSLPEPFSLTDKLRNTAPWSFYGLIFLLTATWSGVCGYRIRRQGERDARSQRFSTLLARIRRGRDGPDPPDGKPPPLKVVK